MSTKIELLENELEKNEAKIDIFDNDFEQKYLKRQ